ncbi:helix-turn-helix transcriptional regulator [Ekhidna sp. To15]|uniref:helix-turn-helix transcriptional regulator n=1 Tax=Ekhidna sp. To15 TaxID=3395267 RepID=UPI003F521513
MRNLGEGQYFGMAGESAENEIFKLSMTHYEKGERLDYHDHDNDYISILTKGEYQENGLENLNKVLPGHVLFRPKYYSHRNEFNNQESTCFNIEFKQNWKAAIDTKLNLPSKFVQYETGRFPALYKALVAFKLNQQIDHISEHIYDWLFSIHQAKPVKLRRMWVDKVVDILNSELSEFHTLGYLAEQACVHPVYLARAFKEAMGCTIGEYQMNAKLSKSISELLTSNKSISTISHAGGFFDDAHFIRSFKLRYGISPFQFRKRVHS